MSKSPGLLLPAFQGMAIPQYGKTIARHRDRAANLWMRGDRNHCDPAWRRTIVPKNSVGCGRVVLSIRFKYLFVLRPFKTVVLVSLKAGVPRICFKVAKGFTYRLEALCQGCFRSKLRELVYGFVRIFQDVRSQILTCYYSISSSACLAKDSSWQTFPWAACSSPRRTLADASGFR